MYAELRAHFSDEEARAFASRMVIGSRQAMRHAWALKGLVNQFSAEDLRTLSPEARAKWLWLIRSHARAFARETASLRQQLEPVFSTGSASTGERLSITNDTELTHAVNELFRSGDTLDQMIRSAFTISAEGSRATSIRSDQFWRALRTAERVAADISAVQVGGQ